MNRSGDSNNFNSELSVFFKTILYVGSLVLLFLLVFFTLSFFRIASYAFDTYDNYEQIPYHKVGLLLGTSPRLTTGGPNEFFTNRIIAAANLYHKGKIKYILVSGDNQHLSYNEPREMIRALVKQNVPSDAIVTDFAGFSTIDSIIRAKKVFLLDDITIISQEFHNERALFIASKYDIKADAFNARDPVSQIASFKIQIREFFARIKCIFDIYFLNTQPKFLGKPITIGGAPIPKTISAMPKNRTSMIKTITDNAQTLKQAAYIEQGRAIAKIRGDNKYVIYQKRAALRALKEAMQNKEDASNYYGDPWEDKKL